MDPWKVLDIEPTGDVRAIKRAYAVMLKQHKPDKDPDGYQRVRDAFDLAKQLATHMDTGPVEPKIEAVPEPIPTGPTVTPDITLTAISAEPVKATPAIVISETPITDQPAEAAVDLVVEETVDAMSSLEEIHDYLIERLQSIHETVETDGQVSAWQQFQALLASDELLPIDASRILEDLTCEYLEWRLKKEAEADERFPAGLARQIYRHYRWHECGHMNPHDQETIVRIQERAVASSGYTLLQHLANDMKGSEDNQGRRKDSGRLILGQYSEFRTRFRLIWGSFRRITFNLIDEVLAIDDGTFEFELANPETQALLNKRHRFNFDAWFFVVGVFLAVMVTAIAVDPIHESRTFANHGGKLLILLFFSAWAVFTVGCHFALYGLSSFFLWLKRLRRTFSAFILLSEWFRATPMLLLLALEEFTRGSVIFGGWPSLLLIIGMAWLYKFYSFLLVAGSLLVLGSLELRYGGAIHQEVPSYAVTYPLIVMYLMAIELNQRIPWLNRMRINKPEDFLDIGLISAFAPLCCVYGYFILGLFGFRS